jgi:ferric-dicitrate binding protein FerR (iron transport regulator)
MIANVQHWTELIAKRLSGNIRKDEARMLDAWTSRDPEHREYLEYLTQVWAVTGSLPVETELPQQDWDALERRLQTPSGTTLPRISLPIIKMPQIPLRKIAAVAAVILLGVISVALLFDNQRKSHVIIAEAGNLQAYEVVLPDGSKVVLRQGSNLRYNKDFAVREVTLTGEGFFSVTHDEERPFSVAAGNGNIRVLGTKFNVKALVNSPVELFVEEGRVAFAPNSSKYEAKIFSEGQAGILVVAANAEVERTAAPGQNITSWINGRLVFDHATLDHVLTDLTRHFSVPIQVADSALFTCELKADFDNATLENVLETLRFSLNLDIDKSGDGYIVSGEPCATDIEN